MKQLLQAPRLSVLAALVVFAGGCGDDADGPRSWFARGSGRPVAASAADARLDAAGRLDFEVTSDVYRRWTLAQPALRRSEVARAIGQLGRRALTQAELDRAVARLAADPEARAAVEAAGMTPLEYVYATVAIGQAMAVASGRLGPRRDDAGVPRQNVEIVDQHREEILGSGVAVDTAVLVLPEAPPPEPVLPAPLPPDTATRSVPPAAPIPADTTRPAPMPREPAPLPTPAPTPTTPPPAAPAPVPTPPADPPPAADPVPASASGPSGGGEAAPMSRQGTAPAR